MRNLFTSLIITLVLLGCQTPFESKTQAENKVNKNGYRIGRWVDYLNSDGQPTKTLDGSKYYVLSEYKDGKPIGYFKLFKVDNTIERKGTFVGDTNVYDKYNVPFPSHLGPITFYENGLIFRKEIPNEKGRILKQVFYSKNNDINKIDSFFIEYNRFPSQDLMTVTFKNDGNDKYIVYYDESPWIEKEDTNTFHNTLRSGSDYLDPLIKSNFEGKFSKYVIDEFKSLMEPGELLDRIHYIDFGRGKADLQAIFKNALSESPRTQNNNSNTINRENALSTKKDAIGRYKFELSDTKDYSIMIYDDGTVMGMASPKRMELDNIGKDKKIDKGTWKIVSENSFEIYWDDIPTWHCKVKKNGNGQIIGFIEDSGELIEKLSSDPWN